MIPRVSEVSRWSNLGALPTNFVFLLIFCHWPMSVSSSRVNVSCVTSSPTVRTITPPESLGSTFCTCSRRRWRSARSPILRLTPTRDANGM